MNAAASITTDDGDKVNHGWSQLDIAKHSTNTFISSLGDEDFICVVTYSDGANVRPRASAQPPRARECMLPPSRSLPTAAMTPDPPAPRVAARRTAPPRPSVCGAASAAEGSLLRQVLRVPAALP